MSDVIDLLPLGRRTLAGQAFSKLLGTQLVALSPSLAELHLLVSPQLLQQNGFVHGGVLAYLADNALAFAGGASMGAAVVTSEFKLNYVRPAQGQATTAPCASTWGRCSTLRIS